MSYWARYKLGSRVYQLDDNDVLWLARALLGECGRNASAEDYLAVAHCMMQRWLRWPKSNNKWPFFWKFVQSFSQPVNPAWANPSPRRRRNHPGHCTPARINRRKRIQSKNWEDIPQRPKSAALLFSVGLAKSPVPDAVNFGADWLVARQGRTGVDIGGNVFLAADQDPGIKWIPGKIEVVI